MQKDTNLQSIFRGRNGAAILAAASAAMTVYGVSAQDQAAITEGIPAILALASGAMALISKIREMFK